MIIRHNKILKPDEVSINEDKFFDFNIDDLSKHYDEVFGDNKKKRKFIIRKVFQIVLLSNKNIILILAGSLASLPVNILTGFYDSASFTSSDWVLHILQLITSILFYTFFLRFVYYFLFIREKSEEYINTLITKDSHYSRNNIVKAIRNIEYYSCMKKYKYVCLSLIGVIVFGIILFFLLFIPPNFFFELIDFYFS